MQTLNQLQSLKWEEEENPQLLLEQQKNGTITDKLSTVGQWHECRQDFKGRKRPSQQLLLEHNKT